MVVIGVLDLSVYLFLIPEKAHIPLIRLFITCVLAWFFYRGANWARWVVAIFSLLGFIGGVIMIFVTSATIFSIPGLMIFLYTAYEGAVLGLLLFSTKLNDHFSSYY